MLGFNLLLTNKPLIIVQQVCMQLQSGGIDWAVCYIATATVICNGQNPDLINVKCGNMFTS